MPDIQSIILSAPAILFCLTIHEYAHGLAALRLGDPTAKYAGRLTLNPFKHLDPIGTISLFLFRMGWAKPVPINPMYFRNPKRDIMLSALAGPAANFLSAIVFGLILRVVYQVYPVNQFINTILVMFFYFNIILGTFNLLPIPPLDGSKIVYYLLPDTMARQYAQLERYGLFILLGIIVLGSLSGVSIFSFVIYPVIRLFSAVIIGT
jgi:Zn-dependent protease